METSKKFLWLITLITILIVGFSVFQMVRLETIEPLVYLVPSIFGELGAATGVYYWKSKNENKIKMTLSAIKELSAIEELDENQTRIIESLVSTLE